jgi:tetratricopeptide (TPR) repeat protein
MSFKNFILASLICISSSCALFSKKIMNNYIIVNTSKPAIMLYNDNGKKIVIGNTPITMNVNDLVKKYNIPTDAWLNFYVESPGYVTESFLLKAPTQKNIEIQINLKPLEWWNDSDKTISSIVVDKLGKNFQIIYSNIREGNLDKAFALTENLLNIYPNAAILYDIKGSIYILKNEIELAIASYERSLQISKDNPDTEQILIKLRKKRSR